MPDPLAIHDDELDGLFSLLQAHRTVALGVSGGSDSMALMLLVARWLQLRATSELATSATPASAAPEIIVLTVDHALRPGSASEARHVARTASALGFAHNTLVWEADNKPTTGLQAAARAARYQLMRDFLAGPDAARSYPALVTAHHQDDQAETLLMRLARGSGVDGLSAMAPADRQHGLTLLRPLLGIDKDRLQATLRQAGLNWRHDPSNDNTAFERVRLRSLAPQLKTAGLSNEMMALSARRLARARQALEQATSDLASAADLDHHDEIYATLDYTVLAAALEELRIRLLTRLLIRYGGGAERPRLAAIERLSTKLASGRTMGATLAGCHVTAARGVVTICREAGRADLPELMLAAPSCAIWDNRLLVCAVANDHALTRIAALGLSNWTALRGQYKSLRRQQLPARAAATIPAFYQGDDLLAVPQLALIEPALGGPLHEGHALFTVSRRK